MALAYDGAGISSTDLTVCSLFNGNKVKKLLFKKSQTIYLAIIDLNKDTETVVGTQKMFLNDIQLQLYAL